MFNANGRFVKPAALILFCYWVMLSGLPAQAQIEPNFLGLQRAIARLLATPLAKTDLTLINGLRDRTEAFETHLKEAHSGSPEEAAAVRHLTNIISLAAKQTDLEEARTIVSDASKDLDLKNRYYGSRLGVSGVSRGLVKVIVNTVRDGKPEPGFLVYCNAYRWADTTNPMKTFPKLSTPTETSMMPGYYRCFASRAQPEKRSGERLVEIGLDGKDQIGVDIPVLK